MYHKNVLQFKFKKNKNDFSEIFMKVLYPIADIWFVKKSFLQVGFDFISLKKSVIFETMIFNLFSYNKVTQIGKHSLFYLPTCEKSSVK